MAFSFGKGTRSIWQGFRTSFAWKILVASLMAAVVGGFAWTLWQARVEQQVLIAQVQNGEELSAQLGQVATELEILKNEDQVMKNASLSAEIKAIEGAFNEGSDLFESRSDLVLQGVKVIEIDTQLAVFLSLLSQRKWKEATAEGVKIRQKIADLIVASAPKVAVPVNAPASNTLPGSGYTRQKVATGRGEFVVSMVVAPGARAVIETAGDSDCSDNCPVKSLAEHVGASGGFAGINGAYFCPPDYAQCQGKVNTFDTLAVNGRTKAVINRANNVYSTVPLVAAYGSGLSFYDQTVQWGADTSAGGGLANYPRLLRDGGIATEQENGKGTRGFIGIKDGAIVIGHVFAASFADTAVVLQTLGLQNAMNLDGGGSTALWFEGGYKAGPGRALPTAIVLVR